MAIMLNQYEVSVARKIKALPGFVCRTGLLFIDLEYGHQKRVTVSHTALVTSIQSNAQLVPDLSDYFLVGMLQEALGWPEIKDSFDLDTKTHTIMVGPADNIVLNKHPTVGRAIGLYNLSVRRNNLLPF